MTELKPNPYTGDLEVYEVKARRYSGSFHYVTEDAFPMVYENRPPAGALMGGFVAIFMMLVILAALIFSKEARQEVLALIFGLVLLVLFASVYFSTYFKHKRLSEKAWESHPEYIEEFAEMHARWLSEAPAGDDTLLEDPVLYWCEVERITFGQVFLLTEPIRGVIYRIHIVDEGALDTSLFPIGKRFHVQVREDVHMKKTGEESRGMGTRRNIIEPVKFLTYRIIDVDAMRFNNWDWRRLIC